MAHGRDQRNLRSCHRAYNHLLVEGPQVLKTATAPGNNKHVGPGNFSIGFQPVKAVDRRRHFGGGALALHLHRPQQHMTRKPVGNTMQNVADHRPCGRRHHADACGQHRQRFLPLFIEQSFGGQFLAAFLQQLEQRAFARQFHGVDDELIAGPPRIGGQTARCDHLHAFLGLQADLGEGAAPDDGVQNGVFVLEAHVAVAGRSHFGLGDLAPHAHESERILDGAFQSRRNRTYRQGRRIVTVGKSVGGIIHDAML